MSVIINDFEVVAEPPPSPPPAPPASDAPPPPAREAIEQALARRAERLSRVRAH